MTNIIALRFQTILSRLVLVILAAFIGLIMAGPNYDWPGMVLVVGGVGILSFFLLPRLARAEGVDFLKILIFALLLKLIFAMINYYFAFSVYGGEADAIYYHRVGTTISRDLWNLDFDKVAPFLNWGTDFICLSTGVIYTIIGPSILGGFLVYALLAFLGCYYFYRAFRIAFPDGNKTLYALLSFFFPTILFWTSAIGKDALMSLFLGLFAYGCAQLIQNRPRGLVPLALGFLGALWVRPHIAAIVILAFALAFFLPLAKKRPFGPAIYVIGLLTTGGLAWLLMPQVMSFLNLKEFSPNEILAYIQHAQVYTDIGTSTFQPIDLNNPLNYLMAPVTLFFRPFPWEAHNPQALVESFAALVILALSLWRIKNLGRSVASAVSDIYLRYILIFIVIFIIIFAATTNFGTLARERVMVQPFFFMLLCYETTRLKEKKKQSAAASMGSI